ncbi:MAG: hypothetical protein ACFFKA_20210, partial [Candidatus Thorarchaeota archaeon]
MQTIFPKDQRKRIEDKFILPYQEDIKHCLQCPSFGHEIINGAWGMWKDKISYLFIRSRGPSLPYMTEAPLEIALQEYIKEAGITEEDGFCILSLAICRPPDGANDLAQRESVENCSINFDSLMKSFIHINKMANVSPPKALILGADTFRYLFPNEYSKNESLKRMKSGGPWAHPNYPDISFRLTYDTNAQLENQAFLQVLRTDVKLLATSKEEKLKMTGNYKLVETYAEFTELMNTLDSSEGFSFDIETSGLRYLTMKKIIEKKAKRKRKKIREEFWEKDMLIGISFSYERKAGYYLPLYVKLKHFTEERETYLKELTNHEHPLEIGEGTTRDDYRFWFGVFVEPVYNRLKAVLENPNTKKYAHNGKFDCSFLKAWWGIDVQNFYWDSMLASHVINENAF